MVEYRILGPLEVVRDGAEVVLSANKHRTLLLALLVSNGTVCSTDHLLEALWGDRQPASAGKLLQAYVSHLRSVLGAGAIHTEHPGYRLRAAVQEVDAGRFGLLHADARRALADGNAELAASLAGRALSLWRGPALADVVYDAFADREAGRLEELRLQCLEDRLEADLALGGHERVLAELAQLCQEHPLRERLHERRALALYRSGRQAEALEALAAARRHLLDELGLDPDPRLGDLEHSILTHDPALDLMAPAMTPAGRRTVPRPPDVLLGRERDLAELGALLSRDEVRLVTLSGAGGSGKTRLAVEVAHYARDAFANGAALAELASIRDPVLVLPTIAHSLGVSETTEQTPQEALIAWLRPRQMLLVVDNLEHVIDAATDLARLVKEAPMLTVLVTSRRVLHVTGEHVYPLSPLALEDAGTLFAARALARDRSSGITADDEVVLGICRSLDCLPLAVELAAARTSALDPRSLRDRLQRSIGALGAGPRDAPARQQTLADTVQWSTDLLSSAERRALARLSVFAGGCSLDAAEAVSAAEIGTIEALVDSSLLQRTVLSGEHRFAMLETIRQHAGDLLDTLGDRDSAEAAHGSHYLALAEAAPLKGPGRPEALAVLDCELDNLRTAYDRAELADDHLTALRFATALYRYWYARGLFREGRDRIAVALEATGVDSQGDSRLQAEALQALAGLRYLLGEDAAAEETADLGVQVGMGADALEAVLGCHTVLGLLGERRGDLGQARKHILLSAALAEQLGLERDVMIANTNLGEIALQSGDLGEARQRLTMVHEWNIRSGTDDTYARLGLGEVARREGLLDEAAGHFAEARDLADLADAPHNALMAVLGLASVAADRGDAEIAGRRLGWVSAMVSATSGELLGVDGETYRRTYDAVLAAVGPQRLAELLAEGKADANDLAVPD